MAKDLQNRDVFWLCGQGLDVCAGRQGRQKLIERDVNLFPYYNDPDGFLDLCGAVLPGESPTDPLMKSLIHSRYR